MSVLCGTPHLDLDLDLDLDLNGNTDHSPPPLLGDAAMGDTPYIKKSKDTKRRHTRPRGNSQCLGEALSPHHLT